MAEDTSLILYAMPFILSGLFSLFLWKGYQGSVGFPPREVYFLTTKNPILFVLGLVSVCLAAIIEVWSKSEGKEEILILISTKLRVVSYISLFFAFLFAFTADASPSINSAIGNLLEGKFAIIFPLFLMILSYLILPLNILSIKENYSQVIVLTFLLLSPLSLYALWSLKFAWSITIGISGTLLILACIIYYIVSKG